MSWGAPYFLSFPTISCGEIFKGNSTYAKKARSQIRVYDRRCAVVPKVLYMYKFYEMQRIQSSISIAMIRQFGLPTFFITLSAAESKWNEHLVILSLLLDSRDITEEEAPALSSAEKARSIRSDPVTRYLVS